MDYQVIEIGKPYPFPLTGNFKMGLTLNLSESPTTKAQQISVVARIDKLQKGDRRAFRKGKASIGLLTTKDGLVFCALHVHDVFALDGDFPVLQLSEETRANLASITNATTFALCEGEHSTVRALRICGLPESFWKQLHTAATNTKDFTPEEYRQAAHKFAAQNDTNQILKMAESAGTLYQLGTAGNRG